MSGRSHTRSNRQILVYIQWYSDRMTAQHDQLPVITVPEPKVAVSIRLDRAIVEYYRATGRLWQTRINADLAFVIVQRKAARRRKGAK